MIVTKQVHGAIQAAMTGDATLTALVPSSQFGTWLEDETIFPHILFSISDDNRNLKGEVDLSMILTVDVWTKEKGESAVYDIRDALVNLLDSSPLTIASGDFVTPFYDGTSVSVLDDGITRSATISFLMISGR